MGRRTVARPEALLQRHCWRSQFSTMFRFFFPESRGERLLVLRGRDTFLESLVHFERPLFGGEAAFRVLGRRLGRRGQLDGGDEAREYAEVVRRGCKRTGGGRHRKTTATNTHTKRMTEF